MSEPEFVRHTINENGMTFSREKIGKVLDIPEPIYAKEMKGFLGVTGYFHDHIRDYSNTVRPLHKMIKDYERTRRLKWDDECREAFRKIKEDINNCPTLFFIDDESEIFLHTDASLYGIGAYLFQVKNGVEKPVAFMSKLLTPQEINWNTTEKEAYAIVYAFKKFEYLIRDRKFVLRTDHENLIYIDTENNAKVKRWKIMIQEYDFWIEHIAGIENVVADAFSRLLVIKRDMLYLLGEFDVPKEIRERIEKVHDGFTGHHGVERTLEKLKKRGEKWTYMREHVRRFIKSCPFCQKMSYLKTPIHTHPFTVACYEPMERFAIDSIGPLPPDDEGNCHIVVIIDCFTRFIMLYAVKDLTATVFVKTILRNAGIFGMPAQILTDNGTQFVNEMNEELMRLVGTEYITTLAYSKEENSLVERANKEVMRHLRAMIFANNDHTQWDFRFLPMVQRIINSSRNESIGVSPAKLLFGNAIDLDRGIFLPHHQIADNQKALST